ncbi:hypothetical protein SAMD00019534_062820 [Acytostelium subglobosum LB1]|uniref:hypothetical protein n=1 Tax=Acytostelium subglobosum LB1 TaxID=1410327 RepID=UPI0006447D93|nr:hypothetical protein SAMD00019534_062820 [Acytostelium subglobosum LB1]GAM23107.1 hypothetical protein SAMD00019534_062820 [Acytostelium subglobosum LB1]|eukprot:XP_012754334.1 hypothetical protein SAMD00019534_062820 [Acytostelium subglobosum LB1]
MEPFINHEPTIIDNNNADADDQVPSPRDLVKKLATLFGRSNLYLYDILEVKRNASKDEIINSYQAKAMLNHDKPAVLKQLNSAVNVLTNDRRRYEYDQEKPLTMSRVFQSTVINFSARLVQFSLHNAAVFCQSTAALLSPQAQFNLWRQLWSDRHMFHNYSKNIVVSIIKSMFTDQAKMQASTGVLEVIKRCAITALVIAPFNLAMTARLHDYSLGGFGQVFKLFNARALWTSFAAQFLMEMTTNALRPVVEAVKDHAFTYKESKGIKKLFYYLLYNPITTSLLYVMAMAPVATLLHQSEMQAFIPLAQRLNIVQLAKNNWQQGGINAFYRGIVPMSISALIQFRNNNVQIGSITDA